jgi:hypothetical protein
MAIFQIGNMLDAGQSMPMDRELPTRCPGMSMEQRAITAAR